MLDFPANIINVLPVCVLIQKRNCLPIFLLLSCVKRLISIQRHLPHFICTYCARFLERRSKYFTSFSCWLNSIISLVWGVNYATFVRIANFLNSSYMSLTCSFFLWRIWVMRLKLMMVSASAPTMIFGGVPLVLTSILADTNLNACMFLPIKLPLPWGWPRSLTENWRTYCGKAKLVIFHAKSR